MSQHKCEYFNKGYCKQKDKCSKTHPLKECDGDCNDKRTCLRRHGVSCKIINQCAFYASKSCDFLHVEHIGEVKVIEGVDITDTIDNIHNSVKTTEEKILMLMKLKSSLKQKLKNILNLYVFY